jgi:hypothetical protein
MEKRAENTFVAGLNTDRHPLTSQKTELIDAQNIDLIAIGEGYQLILQKREGNSELLLLPPVWNNLYTYLVNEYATESGNTYRSLGSSLNKPPSTNPSDWQLQPTLLVSAGLRPGFIPLAVKEFNNIAYIISVDPSTLIGEIGTFPSPDYTKFIYDIGTAIAGGATITGPRVWDPRIDPPGYGFSLTGIPGSGTEEALYPNLLAEQQLSNGGFDLTNTGTLADTFNMTSTVDPNVLAYVDGVGPFNFGTDVISASPGQVVQVRFKVQTPFGLTPYVTADNIITVTAVSDPLTPSITYEYKYHTVAAIKGQSTSGPLELGSTRFYPDLKHNASGTATFLWDTNYTISSISSSFSIDRAPGDPGSNYGTVYYTPTKTANIHMAPSTIPVSTVPRTATLTLTVNFIGGHTDTFTFIYYQSEFDV